MENDYSNISDPSQREGSYGKAILIGGAAALALSCVYAGILIMLKAEIGWFAILVGLAIGYVVKKFASYDSVGFGIVGALLAAGSTWLGEYLVLPFSGYEFYFEFDAMSLVFLVIAAVEAFAIGRNRASKE